jgi:type IV pilus assembly protein PilB
VPGLDTGHFIVRTLLADRVISEQDVTRASEQAKTGGGDVIGALVSLGIVSPRKLAIAKAKICEYPFVDIAAFEIDVRNATLIPRTVAERLQVFPLFCVDGVASVAMLDPLNLQAIDQVRQVLRTDVDPVIVDAEQLRALIARAYSIARTMGEDQGKTGQEEELTTGEEPIVAAVNQILVAAIDASASDVHINPDETDVHLRYRVDGALRQQQGPGRAAHPGIVQRLKVLSKLDLTQTRKPQDGKFRFVHRGEAIDIRLSLIPTIHGENVVMRLLRQGSRLGSIDDLGMPPDVAAVYRDAIFRPHGMILVTGPTGSGKTTTLYTALANLNTPERNIITIEDPVEIRLPMVRQVQVTSEIGLTFASALRSVLRQDPDVILVGEIRDQETAKIAVQAALTGHLVLSTLHTNDAVGAIARLRDLDVPAFAVVNALLCSLAQRLAKRVCEQCAVADPGDARLLASMGLSVKDATGFRIGTGCAACANSGVRGRLGVFEIMRMSHRLQGLTEALASPAQLRAAAIHEGMRSMWHDGLDKARLGHIAARELLKLRTSFDEAEAADPIRDAA